MARTTTRMYVGTLGSSARKHITRSFILLETPSKRNAGVDSLSRLVDMISDTPNTVRRNLLDPERENQSSPTIQIVTSSSFSLHLSHISPHRLVQQQRFADVFYLRDSAPQVKGL